MAEKKLVTLTLICVILSMGIAGTVMALNLKDSEIQAKTDEISELENQKDILAAQLSSSQNTTTTLETQLDALQTEKQNLETQITDLQNETATLETQTETLQTEKQTLETQVADLQNETATLDSQLLLLEAQVAGLQDAVEALEAEVIQSYDLGYAEGESDGYLLGYDEGYLQAMEDVTENGWYLIHPTYAEMAAFIEADKTDENTYNQSYVCYDFSADVIANALEAGYMCGFVYVEYSDSAHAVVCFNTTDYGLIYIEPQNDAVITLAIGQMYLGKVIVDLGIIW